MAASTEAKSLYLASTLYSNISNQVSPDIALSVVRDWIGVSLTQNDYGVEQYIDHQSIFTLPCEWSGKGIHKQFFMEFKDYLLQDGIVILGGNDNNEESHPLLAGNTAINIPIPTDNAQEHYVARKDDSGYWAIFNRSTGNKIRFSFDDFAIAPVKSDVPELVDLKITDWCDQGCTYCYQNSTPEGVHAKETDINNIAYKLYNANVFEVAIGGGEPTAHPQFAKILKQFKHYGVVPNFTTKSLKWTKEIWARDVLRDCGGFAYSVTNHKQIPKFVATMKKLGYPEYPKRLYIHYVLGSTTFAEYIKILDTAYTEQVQVTLLGYKLTGRGKEFTPHNHEKWLSVIKQMREEKKWIRIGIDTAIAQEWGRTIQLEGVSECLFHKYEGKFSCYIDAVSKKIAPSSYSIREEFKPFDDTWLDVYRQF